MLNENSGTALINVMLGEGGKYVPSTIFPTVENPGAGFNRRYDRDEDGVMEESPSGFRHTHALEERRVPTPDGKTRKTFVLVRK